MGQISLHNQEMNESSCRISPKIHYKNVTLVQNGLLVTVFVLFCDEPNVSDNKAVVGKGLTGETA